MGYENGTQIPLSEANKIASDNDMDLILLSNKNGNILCTINMYDKYVYNLKKREKENNKKQKLNNKPLKTIKIGYNIGEHDLSIKLNQVKKFLEVGHPVSLLCEIRSHRIYKNFKDKAEYNILNIISSILDEDLAKVQDKPKWIGEKTKKYSVTLKPKK